MPISLKLRPAIKEDSRLLFEWANDPEVRVTAFATEQIPWEDHELWFERKLRDEHCYLYIAVNDGQIPVGQIRFDIREDGEAEVDVHLAPAERGKGYGTALITEGLQMLFLATDVRIVHSFVKMKNNASRNAFLKAGFKEQGTEHMHGQEVYHFLYKRP